jgi:hypothetical protein
VALVPCPCPCLLPLSLSWWLLDLIGTEWRRKVGLCCAGGERLGRGLVIQRIDPRGQRPKQPPLFKRQRGRDSHSANHPLSRIGTTSRPRSLATDIRLPNRRKAPSTWSVICN